MKDRPSNGYALITDQPVTYKHVLFCVVSFVIGYSLAWLSILPVGR